YNSARRKVTKPPQDGKAVKDLNDQQTKNLRRLCKMVRAWRNKHGEEMGGYSIDSLAFIFLKSTSKNHENDYRHLHRLRRDSFKYLSEIPDQDHYKAPGSNQNVKFKKKFQKKAKEAYELCLNAIKAEGSSNQNDKWKKVYGRPFPSAKAVEESVEKASA